MWIIQWLMLFVTAKTDRKTLSLALRMVVLVLVHNRGLASQPLQYSFKHSYQV